ncbi:MAG: type I restriction-modification system endonuclease [Blastopirellula sp.]|nr:MAG: type I restriction-modification system endonuclease [Blastopirellula sp.]
MASQTLKSPNFYFLAKYDDILLRHAALAERYVFEDPNSCLVKLRQFAELLAKHCAADAGVPVKEKATFLDILNDLWSAHILGPEVSQLFHELRKTGNEAVHHHLSDQREALHQLQMARKLAVWFHRVFGNAQNFKAGPFIPPPNPGQVEKELQTELDRLQNELIDAQGHSHAAQATAAEHAKALADAESNAQEAYAELDTALELAADSEQQLKTERIEFQTRLASVQAKAAPLTQVQKQAVVETAQQESEALDLNEAETRRIIDAQLREAEWEVDTEKLTYKNGTRPQKGKNLAIAEWPTETGPADYALFAGLTPIAIVEAKRKRKDVAAGIEQSKRYSSGYTIEGEQISPGDPWGKFQVPFLFATNGRPYLKQIRTKSGIWFLDARRSTNHPKPLEGWYTPKGLTTLLKQATEVADEKLETEFADYLPLRDYQQKAVQAVEKAIIEGRREMLLAMATGTGKTRTCLGIMYRLIKAKRFRRILFLVDRTSLGEQATDSFKDVRLENHLAFTDIYDVKELSDIAPDADTKLQVATIQGMVKRILYADDRSTVPPVDQYDCIIVDECHRGYNLDRDMSDAEISFRSEVDYISKYSHVLDHFDAVKIGLTATPALHTTEIFGGPDKLPVYQYSYRQAVIDGYLVDHEPPIRIVTQLAEEGITWEQGEEIELYNTGTTQLELFQTPDEISIEVAQFNRNVITENFNKVVCETLAKHIDPSLPGKTLIFCATDPHADTVVDLLNKAFEEQYGPIDNDVVKKITGSIDKPGEAIRRFKNESRPKIVVTVDLLTTGIDVPAIDKIVFLRRVKSRILYEQMMGRATRLCPDLYEQGEDKDRFLIFDAVDLYASLDSHSSMKPVVASPGISIAQLIQELEKLDHEDHLIQVKEQLVAKLQAKKRSLKGDKLGTFNDLTGKSPTDFIKDINNMSPKEAANWFASNQPLVDLLDNAGKGNGTRLLISEYADQLVKVERGYGKGSKPEDFLESFKKYIEENRDEVEALKIVCQQPQHRTHQQTPKTHPQ